MATITLKTRTTTETEQEITLPAYFKKGIFSMAIILPNEALVICTGESCSIQFRQYYTQQISVEDYEQSTEEEFQAAYRKASAMIATVKHRLNRSQYELTNGSEGEE